MNHFKKEFQMSISQQLFSKKIIFLILMPLLLLLGGCSTDTNNLETLPQIYLLPGETATRTKDICFYIGSDARPKDQTVVNIPIELYSELFSDPVWSIPQGVETNTSEITYSPCMIAWNDGEMEYSVPGAQFSVSYEVSASTSAAPTEGNITISFEKLNALLGGNIFYVDTLTTPNVNSDGDVWQLNQVVIFSDAAQKEAAIKKDNTTGALVVAGLIVVIIIAIWAVRKLFQSK